ncbi:MAG: hypothetical protein HC800_20350 [Phormidesmis sp. RL_2_1]|nr:hypothetical protein [Phormidesmis sp. RL_2_1]
MGITYSLNQSTIAQDYTLDANSPFLKITSRINWQETQVLLKADFPLNTSAQTATYEIPFGAITRTTQPQTKAEQAQWEVPALRWADLGDHIFGISLMSNCKHGFDATTNHLRLTLLKSPIWPDPNSDQGWHYFTYAIYPHTGTWQSARTVHHARELNISSTIHPIDAQPIDAQPIKAQSIKHKQTPKTIYPTSSSRHSFLHIPNPNLILSAFKPTEDNPNEFILRCYEAHGEPTTLAMTATTCGLPQLDPSESKRVNLLETEMKESAHSIQPWQIVTHRLPISQE